MSLDTTDEPLQIDAATLHSWRTSGKNVAILDVREPWEVALCSLPESLTIPLQSLPACVNRIPQDRPIVVMCHHGGRSAQATQWLRQNGFARAINLAGGINAWARDIDQTMKVY